MHIIMDSSALCHQLAHTIGNLSWEEQKVGIIFGFLREILRLSRQFETNRFSFFWDSRERKRRDIYPQYKAKTRKAIDPVFFEQFDKLKKFVLPEIGFLNIFEAQGYESDDLIARLVFSSREKFVIVTNDSDLYQLLFDGEVSIYNIRAKKKYTYSDFVEEYGIPVEKWVTVKALAGCNSDNVKGIEGIGGKTAIKYLNGELKRDSIAYRAINSREGIAIRDRNLKLVSLPYAGTPRVKLNRKENLSLSGFRMICNKYGFLSLLKPEVIDKWKEHMKLQ